MTDEKRTGAASDRASRAASLILAIRVGSMVLIFAGSVSLARVLGPADRGAQGYLVAVTILLATALGLGAPVGGYVMLTRRAERHRALLGNGLSMSLAAGVLATLVAAALAALGLAPAPFAAVPAWPVAVGVGCAGFVFVTHHIQVALGRGRAVFGAVLSFTPYTIAAVGYLLLAVPHAGLGASILVFALSPWLAVGAAFLRERELGALERPDSALAAATVRQGLRTYPGELAQLGLQRGDVILLGLLAPATALGTYVVAYQTAEPILALASAAGAAILALGATDADSRRGGTVARLIRESLLVGGTLVVAAAVVAPFVIPLVYGQDYEDAVVPFLILLPAVLALAISRIATADLVRRNRLGTSAGIAVVALAVNIALNVVLIPAFAAVGAAVASLSSYALYMTLSLAAVRSEAGFRLVHLVPTRDDLRLFLRVWARR